MVVTAFVLWCTRGEVILSLSGFMTCVYEVTQNYNIGIAAAREFSDQLRIEHEGNN